MGKFIWKIWKLILRLKSLACLAVADYIDTTDFYSIVHSSKDQEFVDWRNNAWRIKWTKFYCYLLWIDLIVTEG